MFRLVVPAVVLLSATLAAPVQAQEWARKMFNATNHNFGAVARDSKTEYRFVITNLYKEDVHIAGVRSSCGCTTPKLTKQTLKSWEKAELIAHFNTDTFRGQRGATLTVIIDQPQYAEVQVRVDGLIRTDLVVNPGAVELGNIEQGAAIQKGVAISHVGDSNWKIVEAKAGSPYVTTEVRERSRNGGHVIYELFVKLAPDAPAGYLNEQITVATTDPSNPSFPIAVEGRIEAELTVSPSSLMIGTVSPGKSVTKKLVLRAKRPFKVLDIVCQDESFTFETSDEAKTMHVIPVTFTAGDAPGKIDCKFQIKTDLNENSQAEGSAVAQILLPLASDQSRE